MPTVAMTITNVGLNMLRDGLSGANTSKIAYFAIGSGTAAPSASDTRLSAETFRKAVSSYTNGIASGELVVDVYLAPTDAVGLDIEEVGIFASSSATSAANSGVLLARGLYAHNPKSALESIDLKLDITL